MTKSRKYFVGILGLVLATAASAATATAHLHRFPIPAKHSYGDGFGAGRGHQGQDVFADCGKKLVAVRDGKIQLKDKHSAAGNYIVLDVEGAGADYAYMHMRPKGLPREGEKVDKGDALGFVGKTGNASGCHLHFERWTSPGYYEGGHASPDVTRLLKNWDEWS